MSRLFPIDGSFLAYSDMHDFLSIVHRPNDVTALGSRGEELAARFLEQNGYRIVLANFKIPVGRNSRGAEITGEIDLIAIDTETLCFIEVKTRSSSDFAEPLAAITRRKQRQIVRTARIYRRIFNLRHMQFRYDAVSIVLPSNEFPRFELVKDMWTDAVFRKKRFYAAEPWQRFI
jgi:putative endonuclease